jgi:hypothetical protein
MIHYIFKAFREAIGIVLIGTLFVAAQPQTVMAQGAFHLDHFQCYDVFGPDGGDIPTTPVTVELEDQFDSSVGITEKAEISVGMLYFCNPTSKTFGGITSGILKNDNHLAFYTFGADADQTPIDAEVKINNQFGDQKFVVQSANVLAVPTQKLEPITHNPPNKLDHFKCYIISSKDSLHDKVELEDQFSLSRTAHKLREPLLFCNPVNKKYMDANGVVKETGIFNPEAHLTCYEMKPPKSPFYIPSVGAPEPVTHVFLSNQFTEGSEWKMGNSGLLCVPTEKLDFKLL